MTLIIKDDRFIYGALSLISMGSKLRLQQRTLSPIIPTSAIPIVLKSMIHNFHNDPSQKLLSGRYIPRNKYNSGKNLVFRAYVTETS